LIITLTTHQIVGIRILEPIGTHGFVPPEVQELTYDDDDDDDDNDDDDDRQGLAVSAAQDIYSLGCTIMWLLERVVTPHGYVASSMQLTNAPQFAHLVQIWHICGPVLSRAHLQRAE